MFHKEKMIDGYVYSMIAHHPRFKLHRFIFADINPLRRFDVESDKQAAIKPYRYICYTVTSNDKLFVGTDKFDGVQRSYDLLQRLGIGIVIAIFHINARALVRGIKARDIFQVNREQFVFGRYQEFVLVSGGWR